MQAEYTFDNLNRLTGLLNKTSSGTSLSSFNYGYDAASRRTKVILSDGQIDYAYDKANQLTQETRNTIANSYSFSYNYDLAGNRTRMIKSNDTINYSYNRLNQLIQQTSTNYSGGNNVTILGKVNDINIDKVLINDTTATINDGIFTAKVPLASGVNSIIAKALDKAGNFTTQTLEIDLDSTAEANYTYDADGNLIQKSLKGEQTLYHYDYNNRLTKITHPDGSVSEYTYDTEGRRIKSNEKGVVTHYFYDGNNVILERDSSGNTKATYTRALGFNGGIGSIISNRSEGKDYYYHYDGQGSVAHLTDASGVVIMVYIYDALGNVISQTGSLTQGYQFQTKEYSSPTGLVYFGARYYDSLIGRFITPDPLGMADGPNLYLYVNNNPVNWLDPYGLCAEKGGNNNPAVGLAVSIGSNTAKVIYQNLDAAKFNSLWENAAYQKYAPAARGAWSGLQGVGILLGSKTYLNIIDAAVAGKITEEQAQLAINIHTQNMILKASIAKGGFDAGTLAAPSLGPFAPAGPVVGAVVIGGIGGKVVDILEQKVFRELGIYEALQD
jgi:RHS repeat-associated protein